MDFARDFSPLARWFGQRGIPTKGLTVILNFRNAEDAVRFEYELQRDLATDLAMTTTIGRVDVREFTVMGVTFKIESPVHTP